MTNETEQKIRKVLDAVKLLRPISVRLILNYNVGKPLQEDIGLIYAGKTNGYLGEKDYMFYGIMRTQENISIPSILSSELLGDLRIGDAGALFYPMNTDYGYAGFLWVCFAREDWHDRTVERMNAFAEWMRLTLREWLEQELNYQLLARCYVDLLEDLNIPTLIILSPEQTVLTNPLFESMKENRDFIKRLRQCHGDTDLLDDLFTQTGCRVRQMDFPGGRVGNMLIFPPSEKTCMPVYNESELAYYRLLVQRARGQISLLDSTDGLNDIQRNYVNGSDLPLKRLEALFLRSTVHYRNRASDPNGFEVINIADMIKEVNLDLSATARNKQLSLRFTSKREEGSRATGRALGDPWLLTLCFYTLIDNAIRTSRSDSEFVEIRLRMRDMNWILEVEDHGSGIAPLDLEKIRGEEDYEDPNENLRGIPLLKYAVSLHAGTLTVESRLGKGSTFAICVPYYS